MDCEPPLVGDGFYYHRWSIRRRRLVPGPPHALGGPILANCGAVFSAWLQLGQLAATAHGVGDAVADGVWCASHRAHIVCYEWAVHGAAGLELDSVWLLPRNT